MAAGISRAIPIPAGSGVIAGVGPQGLYAGLRIAETAGAVARIRLWDGTSATGTIVDEIRLLANASDWRDDSQPLLLTIGLYYELVSGTVEGSIRVA